jgi:hypothetical protein
VGGQFNFFAPFVLTFSAAGSLFSGKAKNILNILSKKTEMLAEVDSIINIITKIVKTSQKKDSTNPKLKTQNFIQTSTLHDSAPPDP